MKLFASATKSASDSSEELNFQYPGPLLKLFMLILESFSTADGFTPKIVLGLFFSQFLLVVVVVVVVCVVVVVVLLLLLFLGGTKSCSLEHL